MHFAYALTVAYSPSFSSPIAFTCIVCQNFPCKYFPCTVINSSAPSNNIACHSRYNSKLSCNDGNLVDGFRVVTSKERG